MSYAPGAAAESMPAHVNVTLATVSVFTKPAATNSVPAKAAEAPWALLRLLAVMARDGHGAVDVSDLVVARAGSDGAGRGSSH
jgi:hypothetical protein